jgi:hypothetical protein
MPGAEPIRRWRGKHGARPKSRDSELRTNGLFKTEARKSEADLRNISRAEAGRRMREMMEQGRRKNSATANAHPDRGGTREEFEKARAEWKAAEKAHKQDQAWRAKEAERARKTICGIHSSPGTQEGHLTLAALAGSGGRTHPPPQDCPTAVSRRPPVSRGAQGAKCTLFRSLSHDSCRARP